jgi:hypothetical protein
MATVRDYFDTDFKTMAIHADWEARDPSGGGVSKIRARIHQDFDGNAKYWSFYVPDAPELLANLAALFRSQELERCVLSPEGDTVYAEVGFGNYSERANTSTFVFTRRIFLYIDSLLSLETRRSIAQHGLEKGFHVIVRDKDYAAQRSQMQKPMAFISYDSRDKDPLVRELAQQMSTQMCPVWFDEYSLKVGDSLRAAIEKGLKETKKCILVLSPNFFSNTGWARAEFDSIYTREIVERGNVMLPVWHNVGVKEVYEYSPRLADKVGLSSELGVAELARRLSNAVKHDGI